MYERSERTAALAALVAHDALHHPIPGAFSMGGFPDSTRARMKRRIRQKGETCLGTCCSHCFVSVAELLHSDDDFMTL